MLHLAEHVPVSTPSCGSAESPAWRQQRALGPSPTHPDGPLSVVEDPVPSLGLDPAPPTQTRLGHPLRPQHGVRHLPLGAPSDFSHTRFRPTSVQTQRLPRRQWSAGPSAFRGCASVWVSEMPGCTAYTLTQEQLSPTQLTRCHGNPDSYLRILTLKLWLWYSDLLSKPLWEQLESPWLNWVKGFRIYWV